MVQPPCEPRFAAPPPLAVALFRAEISALHPPRHLLGGPEDLLLLPFPLLSRGARAGGLAHPPVELAFLDLAPHAFLARRPVLDRLAAELAPGRHDLGRLLGAVAVGAEAQGGLVDLGQDFRPQGFRLGELVEGHGLEEDLVLFALVVDAHPAEGGRALSDCADARAC